MRLNSNKNRDVATTQSATLSAEVTLEMAVSENLAPGTFCIKYAVYDQVNRVSNYLEHCVEVLTIAGENSEFLTRDSWALAHSWTLTDGVKVEYPIGQSSSYNLSRLWECNDGVLQNVEVETTTRREYEHLTMLADGTHHWQINISTREKLVPSTNCEMDPSDITQITEIDYRGSWSYNDTKQQLTLVNVWDSVGVAHTFINYYRVGITNNQLMLEPMSIDGTVDEKGLVFNPR